MRPTIAVICLTASCVALPHRAIAVSPAEPEATAAPEAPAATVPPVDAAPAAEPAPTEMPALEVPPSVEAVPAVTREAAAARLLERADEHVRRGELTSARYTFRRITEDYPDTLAAAEARRALQIFVQMEAYGRWSAGQAGASPLAPMPSDPDNPYARRADRFYTLEPYSRLTEEKIRLTWWEKIDFGVTAFLYGTSVGVSYSMALDPDDDAELIAPIVLGSTSYAGMAILYLAVADPDRGDLPLALAIASYVPTSVLLLQELRTSWRDAESKAFGVAIAGTLAVPAAALAAKFTAVDPGDMQLIRDAGFWGMVLGASGMLGFGGEEQCGPWGGCWYREPSTRAIAAAALVGLHGGLGLGILGARFSEVSLERVRITTWGGYGGVAVAAMIGSLSDSERGTYAGAAIGGLTGLVIAFASTSSVDAVPEDAELVDPARVSWMPTAVPVLGSDGQVGLGWGVRLTLP